jgi:hypothetical protein
MALLETDQQKLAERIDAALVVLSNSLEEIGDSPENNCEREWIEDAVTTLKTIRPTDLNKITSSLSSHRRHCTSNNYRQDS